MWFSRKQVLPEPEPKPAAALAAGRAPTGGAPGTARGQVNTAAGTGAGSKATTKARGDAAEAAARAALVRAGLVFVEANFRTPGRGGGEIDLVMRDRDGTLVFVEVRHRASASHGGAAGSIGPAKQQRIVLAARHYLMRFGSPPPCRFDVVLVEGAAGSAGARIEWLKAAFDAG